MTTIASVEAIPVAYPEPNDHGAERHLCLVRVVDSDGRVGWGESVTMWPSASRATAALVDGFAPLVVGCEVVPEAIWRALREESWWYGGAGIASFAVSALDIALWDLRGKILGRPLVDLLGGPCRDALPVVASGHATLPTIPELVEDMASWVRDLDALGVKVGFGKRGEARLGFEHARDVAFVRSLREALGPDKLIMVDLGVKNRWTVAEAVSRTRAFEELGLHWIEEPLGADDPAGYATLRAKTTTLIAYGEREWSVRGLQRVIESGTCDVVGIDPGRAEGITGFVQACRLASARGVTTNAHSWSSAIVLAASLAVSWAMPSCRLFESKPLRNPMQHELAGDTGYTPSGGRWPLPTRPGLGIEVDEAVVDRFRV